MGTRPTPSSGKTVKIVTVVLLFCPQSYEDFLIHSFPFNVELINTKTGAEASEMQGNELVTKQTQTSLVICGFRVTWDTIYNGD